jgi:hypothetical protein
MTLVHASEQFRQPPPEMYAPGVDQERRAA